MSARSIFFMRVGVAFGLTCLVSLGFSQLKPTSLNTTSPWPRYHANNASTGVGGANGSKGIISWIVTGARGRFYSPSIGSDGTIYVGNDDHNLYAINPDGSTKWTFASTSIIRVAPAISQAGNIYFASDDGNIQAVDPTGTLLWSLPTVYFTISSPAIAADGSIIFGGGDGNLYSLNPTTGSVNWSFATSTVEGFPCGIVSSVTIGPDGSIYFGDSLGIFYSVASTGTLNWTHGSATGELLQDAPCVDSNNHIYFVSPNNGIEAVDSNDGSLWTNGSHGEASPGVEPNGDIIYSDQFDALAALDPSNGSAIWSLSILESGAPAIAPDGTIYVGDISGSNFIAVDGLTGNIKWSIPNIYAALDAAIGADGSVYISDNADNLYKIGTNSITSFHTVAASVVGGNSIGAVVQLADPAPSTGVTVNLQSDSADATVPASVSMASGIQAISFTVSTSVVAAQETVHLTATIEGDSVQTSLTINPQVLTGFYVNPTTVTGGYGSRGVVQISSPAASGGASVALQSKSADVTVPASVTIPQGITGLSFSFTTSGVPSTETDTITATFNSGSLQASITLNPTTLSNFYASPTSVIGGHSLNGVVQLVNQAATPGDAVDLQSSSGFATVPLNVTVQGGSTGASFAIATKKVSSTQNVTLTATFGGSTLTCGFAVQPYGLSSFYTSPSTITGGSTTRCVIQLAGPAGPAGNAVTINYGGLTTAAPTTVTVSQGKTGASFAIPTQLTGATAVYTFTATLGSSVQNATLTVNPYPLSNFYISPSTVAGGQNTVGVVQLAGPNGPSAVQVSLQSLSADAIVPTQVAIPGGGSGASFQVTTKVVVATETLSISASLNSVTLQAQLVLNPVGLASFYVSPASVTGGTTTRGVLQLNGPAGAAGVQISLSSGDSNVIFPATITISPGQTGISFPIRTMAVDSQDVATITATQGSNSLQATVTLTP